ncbi:hypothetical protein [Streptomyces sp. NPDC000229]|uniref:hypothetical protein n=1 Tax=Streptomyces sp. NPDC000229 TaxID=3154247 RepID=UPI0033175DC9
MSKPEAVQAALPLVFESLHDAEHVGAIGDRAAVPGGAIKAGPAVDVQQGGGQRRRQVCGQVPLAPPDAADQVCAMSTKRE